MAIVSPVNFWLLYGSEYGELTIWKPPWTDCNIQQHFAFGCVFCVSIVRMSFSRRNWVALLSTLSDFFREQKLTYKSWFFITFCADFMFCLGFTLILHWFCIDFALILQWICRHYSEVLISRTSLHKKWWKIMIYKLIFALYFFLTNLIVVWSISVEKLTF